MLSKLAIPWPDMPSWPDILSLPDIMLSEDTAGSLLADELFPELAGEVARESRPNPNAAALESSVASCQLRPLSMEYQRSPGPGNSPT